MHKVPFEDVILTGDAWSSLKRETPWGQVPVLEVDGKMLAQSRTIMAYVGRVTGLHPEDPFAAAKVDEFCDTVEESNLALGSFSPRRNQPRGRSTSSAAAWHCAAERSA